MSQNLKKGHKKQSGWDVTKSLKVIMGQNVTIFMREMDIKYVRMKCNHGTKCHTVGLAKMCGQNVQLWHFAPKKCSKRNVLGRTNNPSTLWSKVTVDAVNTRTLCWEMFQGCQNVTRTFLAWTFHQGTQWPEHPPQECIFFFLRKRHVAFLSKIL